MKMLLAITTLLIACSSSRTLQSTLGNSYEYKYVMTSPVIDSSLKFEDANIRIRFYITASNIIFNLTNKSNQPIGVHWNDASITQYGRAMGIIHKGIKFVDWDAPMPVTTIAPGSSIEDLVVPTDNISLNESGVYSAVDWQSKELFTVYDRNKPEIAEDIKSNIGQELTLYLPIKIAQQKEIGYVFKFKVNDVVCINCKTVTQ